MKIKKPPNSVAFFMGSNSAAQFPKTHLSQSGTIMHPDRITSVGQAHQIDSTGLRRSTPY
ncbi:MAG: hypothetical protein IMY76_03535 [Chloroflexi bacterium]|nr:hypothetical protein [Chloroflexota bacterium]